MRKFAMNSAKVLSEIKKDVHENIDRYYRDIMIADSLWEQKKALGELQLYMKRQIKKIKEVEDGK
ncbi:hypothetical protein D6117_000526 [Lactococcus lactis]|uniref:hypothetical protein n=1 Tax=Lactococcus lactis TaxID=1358 RepID=UPI000F51DD97|nr:hypothetical protein [Lactococcus lactis]RQD98936.1 hypothetical protein D6109_10500 [Lactococcus lactis]RQE01212.1 hypothetical protein D6107_10875 [Lactococcus lactis]RQE06773.1 hypothetical protein D6110_06990 [Lactococcus lactis]RQE08758.1 hypothetical protein D6108_10670 [Lactococcus lactis]RQE12542.1 hypothetical protein D6113_08585 [Lactococcus lactis]